MVLTGMDFHLVGVGSMEELLQPNQRGKPGYEGYLNDRAVLLPELLRDAGYRTMISGKWHLGTGMAQDPSRRGFDESFVMLLGAASHFSDEWSYAPLYTPIYRENGERVHTPENFFSSDAYTDKLMGWLEAQPKDQPFFAYLPFTAPHDPLHVPDDWLDRYAGRYDTGYDELRAARTAAARRLGLVPEHAPAAPRPDYVPAWNDLPPAEQQHAARAMEIYAAMVENLDHNVGRLLTLLKERGMYDNTLILFFSDNGANGIMLQQNPLVSPYKDWVANNSNNRLENLGRKGSRASNGPGWALASSAPFRLFKAFISEGGVRSPLVVAGPGVTGAGELNHAMASAQDLMPTLLEVAGISHPGQYAGRPVLRMQGKSMWPLLTGKADAVHGPDDTIAFELFGMRSVRRGDWKATLIGPPFTAAGWHLFDIAEDPGETRNLAEAHPERLRDLIAAWETYAEEAGVVLPERPVFEPIR